METMEEVFEDSGVEYSYSESRGWYSLDCPFCDDVNGHLGYNERSKYFCCWKCGKKDFRRTLKEITGKSWKEVNEITKNVKGEKVSEYVHIPQKEVKLPKATFKMDSVHSEYLRGRGFDPAKLNKLHKITYTFDDVPFSERWKIVIPVYQNHALVSYQLRGITDGVRYMSCANDDSVEMIKDCLYGSDLVVGSTVVVMEGVTDVWAYGAGAVALFGKQASDAQIKKLSKYTLRVLWLDPDTKIHTRQLVDALSVFPGKTLVFDPKNNLDPGETPQEEMKKIKKYLKKELN